MPRLSWTRHVASGGRKAAPMEFGYFLVQRRGMPRRSSAAACRGATFVNVQTPGVRFIAPASDAIYRVSTVLNLGAASDMWRPGARSVSGTTRAATQRKEISCVN
ncbi:MAG TPA: hypothetical protein VGK99_14545 [Acidobacteriota bacterium]